MAKVFSMAKDSALTRNKLPALYRMSTHDPETRSICLVKSEVVVGGSSFVPPEGPLWPRALFERHSLSARG